MKIFLFNQESDLDSALQVQAPNTIRNNMLNAAAIVAFFLCAILYIVSLPEAIQNQNWPQLVSLSVGFLLLTLTAFIRKLPYTVRAVTLLTLLCSASFISLFQKSINLESQMLMLFFALAAVVFFDVMPGAILAGLGVLGYIICSWGVSTKFLMLLAPRFLGDGQPYWLYANALLIVLVIIGGSAVLALYQQTLAQLGKQQTLIKTLEAQQVKMDIAVKTRTQTLQKRFNQTCTATEIAQKISINLDPQSLMEEMVSLVQKQFGLYFIGIYFPEPARKIIPLQIAAGEASQKLLAEHYTVPLDSETLVGWVLTEGKTRIVREKDPEVDLIHNRYLPQTRAEIAVPLRAGNKLLGVISLKSENEEAFDEEETMIIEGLARVLANAIENARLYQDKSEKLNEAQATLRMYLQSAWAEMSRSGNQIAFTAVNKTLAASNAELPEVQMPLMLHGQVFGQISLENETGSLTAEDIAFIEAITTQTVLALENARLLDETKRTAERERLVSSITAKVRATTEVDKILRTTVEELGRILGASETIIQLNETEREEVA